MAGAKSLFPIFCVSLTKKDGGFAKNRPMEENILLEPDHELNNMDFVHVIIVTKSLVTRSSSVRHTGLLLQHGSLHTTPGMGIGIGTGIFVGSGPLMERTSRLPGTN